jgi:superfamily I DNA and/or RNA helicase
MLSLSDEFFDVVIVDEAAQVRSSGCAFKPTVVDVVL